MQKQDTPTIKVSGLGKAYKVYERPEARLKQALWGGRRTYFNYFWALRGITFEVAQGESIAVIGRNGSGKSTLLQLFCGTLTPTEGSVQINGRIAALLELGSGFNPEFTGLENIYLYLSILGLNQNDISERLEKILEFADIGAFVSQPVKTYSSGMSLRLAFACIAHVDADILVIDEALAVGDAFFSQKCYRYLDSFKEQGGTLVLVSHDSSSVIRFCEKALLLKNGSTVFCGPTREAIDIYLGRTISPRVRGGEAYAKALSYNPAKEQPSLAIQNESLTLGGDTIKMGQCVTSLPVDAALSFEIKANESCLDVPLVFGFTVKDRRGYPLFACWNLQIGGKNSDSYTLEKDEVLSVSYHWVMPKLENGIIFLDIGVSKGDIYSSDIVDFKTDCISFESALRFEEACIGAVGMCYHVETSVKSEND